MVVVSGLHVVVGTSSVVGVFVDGGVWLLDSSIWLRQPERKERGEKGGESNREYSSKVLASIKSILSMHWYQLEGLYLWTEL